MNIFRPFIAILSCFFFSQLLAYQIKDLSIKNVSKMIDPLLIIGIIIVLFIFVLFILLVKFFEKKPNNVKLLGAPITNYIDTQLSDAGLSEFQKKTIQEIAEVTKQELLDLIKDPKTFEFAIEKLYDDLAHVELLEAIIPLREALGFTIKNPKVKFNKTEVLPNYFKLRVKIPHPSKDLSFVTEIIHVSEDAFWVHPAKVKGKTLDMSNVENLEFKVNVRGQEFFFKSTVLEQIKEPKDAIVIRHTRQIEKLVSREATRYLLSFKCQFSFITKSMKSAKEKPFSSMGIVEDISTGGLKLLTQQIPADTRIGDLVTFSLSEARLDKLVEAKIVKMVPKDKDVNIHIQFQNLTEMDRLYITKFIENELPKYRSKLKEE